MSAGPSLESRRDRLFWGLFVLLSLLNLIPLWSVRIPPMQDAWQHLALVDVIHQYDAPGSIYPDYFLLPRSPRPNLVYYYLTHFLAYLMPSLEVANKVTLSLYLLAFPGSFLAMLRAFGRSRWLAFFAFPLTYNAFFFYGFLSFLLGIPVLFAGLAAYRAFIAGSEETRIRSGVLAATAMVLAFFTHAHSYLLLCLLAGLLWVLHPARPRERLLRLTPFLPGLVFFVPWFIVFFVQQTPAYSGRAFGSIREFFGPKYYSPSEVLSTFYRFVGDHFRDNWDDLLFLAWALILFVLLIYRRAPEPRPGRTASVDLEVLTVALAVSVIALPEHIESQSIVSLRHVFFTVIFFAGWVGVEHAPRRVAVAAIGALVILQALTVANLVRGFRAFEQELDDYPSLFERAQGGKRLLRITTNQESPVVAYGAYWHTQFFYTILKGGISDMQFAEYPHNPIQYRPGMVPPKPPVAFWRSPAWRYFDYLLVRRNCHPDLGKVADRLEQVAEVREWVLYRIASEPLPRTEDRDLHPSARRRPVQMEPSSRTPPVPPQLLKPAPVFRPLSPVQIRGIPRVLKSLPPIRPPKPAAK